MLRAALSRSATAVSVSVRGKDVAPLFMACKDMSVAAKPIASESVKAKVPTFPVVQVRAASSNAYGLNVIEKAYANSTPHQRFLWSSVVMGTTIPVALALSPSILNLPVDLALVVAIPYHMHTGVTDVVSDYAPREWKGPINAAVTLIIALSAVGLLKVTLCGDGIIQSIKSIWRQPKVVPAVKHQ